MATRKTSKNTYKEVTADDLTLRLYPTTRGNAAYFGTLSIDTASGAPFAIKVNVYESKQGEVWVAMPSYQNKDGDYIDLAFPTSAKLRDAINELAAEVVSKF